MRKRKYSQAQYTAYFTLFPGWHALKRRCNIQGFHCLPIKSLQPICAALSTERDLLYEKKIAQHLTAKSTLWLGTQMSPYSHKHTFSGLTPTAWIRQVWNSAELWRNSNQIKKNQTAFPYAKSQMTQFLNLLLQILNLKVVVNSVLAELLATVTMCHIICIFISLIH